MTFSIDDECSTLKSVILGIATDYGNIRYKNNPKSAQHIENGTFPEESDLVKETDYFASVLTELGVKVFRPANIRNQNQIFTRDIGFVIGDVFVKANMCKDNRKPEWDGISGLLAEYPSEKILIPPEGVIIEGGDIVQSNDTVFVGIGERTNWAGFRFLEDSFPTRKFVPLELVVTKDPKTNVLHLDCAFQPVGEKYAIVYPNGFKEYPLRLIELFGNENIIVVDANDMYELVPNIFSVSPEKVISKPEFTRLNSELRRRGVEVIEVPYSEVSKEGGLFRCSTLPLHRKH